MDKERKNYLFVVKEREKCVYRRGYTIVRRYYEKGRFRANKGYFRAFLRVAIYLPISPLGMLRTAYLGQKRKVPNLILFNTIIIAICNFIYIFAV